MKYLVLSFMLIMSTLSFADALEAPRVRAELTIKSSNRVFLERKYSESLNRSLRRCSGKSYWGMDAWEARLERRACSNRARKRYNSSISDSLEVKVTDVISTREVRGQVYLESTLNTDANEDLYIRMGELRDIAKDDEIKNKVIVLQELIDNREVIFKLEADVVNNIYRKHTSKLKIIYGSKRGTVTKAYDKDTNLRDRILEALDHLINGIEEDNAKRNNVNSIINDFSSVEEERDNRFI